MNPEPPSLRLHNSIGRRSRRLFLFYRIQLSSALFAMPPMLCMISWLLQEHGWGWLLSLSRFLWLLQTLGILLPIVLVIVVRLFLSRTKRGNADSNDSKFWQFGLFSGISANLVTLVMLIIGRVDIALYVLYGSSVLNPLFSKQKWTVRDLQSMLLMTALLVAFASGMLWFVLIVALLRIVRQFHGRYSVEALRTKPSRQEYVVQMRERCAAGGG